MAQKTEWEVVSVIDQFVQLRSVEDVHAGSVITLPLFALRPLAESGHLKATPRGQAKARVTIEVSEA